MDLALILITAVLGLTVVIALYIYKVSYVYIRSRSCCDGNVAINLDIAIASLALLDRFFILSLGTQRKKYQVNNFVLHFLRCRWLLTSEKEP